MSTSGPVIFENDKYLLSKISLESFKASLGTMRVKMFVLLDNCPESYVKLFTDLWAAEDLILERLGGIGNRGTLLRQFEVLCEQKDAELVYASEDDYVYHPNSFQDVVAFMRNHPEADFLTPYYHPDYENLSIHRHREKVVQLGGKTWKTVKSTTGTFVTSRTCLRETHHVFKTFLKPIFSRKLNMSDLSIWLVITKHNVFNPWCWLTWPFKSLFIGWSLFAAWCLCWRQILFGKRYHLWSPYPSICTHLSERFYPSGYDWKQELNDLVAREKSVSGRLSSQARPA